MSRFINNSTDRYLNHCKVSTVAALFLCLSTYPSLAGDISMGQSVAQTWCANCHLIGQSGKAIDAAPSFSKMANDPAYTESRLRGWLFNPHPPMPDIELTKVQIDSVIAFIRSKKLGQ